MLKWAVNGTVRQSYLSPPKDMNIKNDTTVINKLTPETPKTVTTKPLANRRKFIHSKDILRRKSSTIHNEMTNIKRKCLRRDKENNLTSTPLPSLTSKIHSKMFSPIRKLQSLKDLSNVTLTPERNSTLSPIKTPKQSKRSMIYERNCFTVPRNNPSQYASTLPTFDVEYSPCNAVPGPILALRGIGIADSYFEKPRYLTDQTITKLEETNNVNKLDNNRTSIPRKSSNYSSFTSQKSTKYQYSESKYLNNNTTIFEDESLTSSRMGDVTLDKMIDAILESARKDKRPPKFRQTLNHPVIMSPTYTPADDPASDLNEMWDSRSEKYLQKDVSRKRRRYSVGDTEISTFDRKCNFNEREVKTPENLYNILEDCDEQNQNSQYDDETSFCLLKRQKAVRRKRKLSLASQQLNDKTEDLFSTKSKFSRTKSIDELAAMETPTGCYNRNNNNNNNNNKNNDDDDDDMNDDHKKTKNISPDSGRNSPSDFEYESPENTNLNTKKRLSYSQYSPTKTNITKKAKKEELSKMNVIDKDKITSL